MIVLSQFGTLGGGNHLGLVIRCRWTGFVTPRARARTKGVSNASFSGCSKDNPLWREDMAVINTE